MRNAEIAAAFAELGTLYELDGANRYRVLAYRDAAKAIRDCPKPVAEMARQGKATELQGIGETIEAKILALLDEGEIPAAAKLKEKMPASLVEVTAVPGLGPKTVRRLWDELGIGTLDDLAAAAKEDRLQGVKGLGAKVEENVVREIERLGAEGPVERRLLDEMREVGTELVEMLRSHPASEVVELAGSARRWEETCKDIDIVATASDPTELARALREHELVAESGSAGSGGTQVRSHNGIAVDLRIVPPAELGNLLQHFTGSAQHNVALRERALKMGLSVSEHGITEVKTGVVHTHEREEDVYAQLGLPYIEPELRQGTGELAVAEQGLLPELVSIDDVRGDLHSHTTLSDGKNTLAEMARAARGRGYEYLALTDHSASHGFGNDVQADALLRRVEEVDELNESFDDGFRLLVGSEVNIGTDGSLDYADEVLAELDWVVASVHTSFQMSAERMTERMCAAIEHPLVDCIGHPTGRLLLRREPYGLDIEAVIAAAAASGTMIEINGNPNRRDLSEGHARMAAAAGVGIVVNTDAHRIRTLANMQYGIATARRAGLTPAQVLNTLPWAELGPRRKRAS